MTEAPRQWQQRADELAAQAVAAGEPTAWFDRLYAEGRDGSTTLAWDRSTPNPVLVRWAEQSNVSGGGRTALVVGCGLGADAAYLHGLGYETAGFDISPTAVAIASERTPEVAFQVGDLFELPTQWHWEWDLVVDVYTVQSMPRSLRSAATARIAELVAEGGTLVVIQSALDPDGDADEGPPWPLTRPEIEAFADHGLTLASLGRVPGLGGPSGAHWLAELTRQRIGEGAR